MIAVRKSFPHHTCPASGKASNDKVIWVQTESKVSKVSTLPDAACYAPSITFKRFMLLKIVLRQEVLTAALEAGLSTMVFDTNSAGLAEQWSQIGRFQAVSISESGDILSSSVKVCSPWHILTCLFGDVLTSEDVFKSFLPEVTPGSIVSVMCTCNLSQHEDVIIDESISQSG